MDSFTRRKEQSKEEIRRAAFIQFISASMAHAKPFEADGAVFSSSLDLLNDPEIKKIRDSAQEKLTNLLLGLVQEGKEQGEISKDLSADPINKYSSVLPGNIHLAGQPDGQRDPTHNRRIEQEAAHCQPFFSRSFEQPNDTEGSSDQGRQQHA